jgi:hypothetical protein
LVKATEEVKHLESSLEELLGVWGTECCHRRRRNKGDLVRSVATPTGTLGISRKAKAEGAPHEKSEEVAVPSRIETTQLDRREGPLLQPSSARR